MFLPNIVLFLARLRFPSYISELLSLFAIRLSNFITPRPKPRLGTPPSYLKRGIRDLNSFSLLKRWTQKSF